MNYIGDKTTVSYSLDQTAFLTILNGWINTNIKPKPFKKIHDAITSRKVRAKHYSKTINNKTFIVTFICGYNDYKLIELANVVTNGEKLGFPRGLSIIWLKENKEFLRINPFLSKFENDKREEVVTINNSVNEIRLAKKFSGSLGLLTAFVYDNETYVVSCAKNSTGNAFSQELLTLLDIWYQNKQHYKELIDFLAQGHNISFEICSMNPELGQHGSSYKVSLPIALIIGNTNSNETFVDFLSDIDAMAIFQKYMLPVEHRYIIKDKDIMQEFIQRMNTERDFITNAQFDAIINNYVQENKIIKIQGTIEHRDLTDVLEGLVLWQISNDIKILKYKFARYTRVTMLIRELITKGDYNHDAIISAINKWADYWVINPENRLLHKSWLLYTMNQIIENKYVVTSQDYLNVVEPILLQAEEINPMDELVFKITPCKIMYTLAKNLDFITRDYPDVPIIYESKNMLRDIYNALLKKQVPIVEITRYDPNFLLNVEKLVKRSVIVTSMIVPASYFTEEIKNNAHKNIVKFSKNIKMIKVTDDGFFENGKIKFEEMISSFFL